LRCIMSAEPPGDEPLRDLQRALIRTRHKKR
jgi:hypothetical protein